MAPFHACRFVLVLTVCLFTLTTAADPKMLRDDGDVMLAAMFSVREAGESEQCGSYESSFLMELYSVRWFIRTLNDANYIPGVKIGLETRMTCYNQELAKSQALELLDTYVLHRNASVPPLFGVVGPILTSTAISVAQLYSILPDHQSIPLVSGSATGVQLRNYKNFFRVIPPDNVQVEALAALLLELQWNYVAIIYTDDDYGREMSSRLRQRASDLELCVPIYWTVGDIYNDVKLTSLTGTNERSRVAGIVFIGQELDASRVLARLQNHLKQDNVEIIFSEAIGLRPTALTDGSNKPYDLARGALVVTPPYRELTEFRKEWNGLWADCNNFPSAVTDNPWLNAVKDQCHTMPLHGPSLFPWYHVQATAVLAAALKELHTTHCGNVSGSCLEFLAAVRDYRRTLNTLASRTWNLSSEFSSLVNGNFTAMENVTFQEDHEIRRDNSSLMYQYEVYNFQSCGQSFCFKQVGNYSSGQVTLNRDDIRQYDKTGQPRTWSDFTVAQCAPERDCSECRKMDLADVMLMEKGDFYVVVVVPVHTRDPDDPFLCGAPRGNLGADFVQAVLYALDEVNKPGGRWQKVMPGTKLGAIFLDSCYSQPVTKNKLLNLHKGRIKLASHNGAWLNESEVKANILPRIAGYLGGFFSVISVAISDVLTEIDRRAYVHLSPTSVSDELSDRTEHPYFMRVVEPAETEVMAMMELLRYLDATYVQIILNPDDPYTRGMAENFKKHSLTYGVCVAQEIEVTLLQLNNPSSTVIDTLRKKASARMVVIILQYEQVVKIMDNINKKLTEADTFTFMGSDAWASRPEVISGKRRLAGSISISEEIALDPGFTSYFRSQDPMQSSNVWLKEFWEERSNCYLNLSMRREGRSPCPQNYRDSYEQDAWIPFYIQALKAFASGVGNALKNTCGTSTKDVCYSLRSKAMVEEVKKVKLNLFGDGDAPVFNANGDGRIGYYYMQSFWNISTTRMQYRRIGNWNSSKLHLKFDLADLQDKLTTILDDKHRNYESTCPNPIDCCSAPTSSPVPSPAPRPSPNEDASSGDSVPVAPVAAVIVVLCVLIFVFILIIVLLYRRHRQLTKFKARNPPSFQISFENGGLSNDSCTIPGTQPIQEADYAYISESIGNSPRVSRGAMSSRGSDYLPNPKFTTFNTRVSNQPTPQHLARSTSRESDHPIPQHLARSTSRESAQTAPQDFARSASREPNHPTPQDFARSFSREPGPPPPQDFARSISREPNHSIPQDFARSISREPDHLTPQDFARSTSTETGHPTPQHFSTADGRELVHPQYLAMSNNSESDYLTPQQLATPSNNDYITPIHERPRAPTPTADR